jgi:hypothetical protein
LGNRRFGACELTIYVDLHHNLLKPFQYGDSRIRDPGCYAIGHSFDNENLEKAHQISNLVSYGEVMCNQNTHKPIIWLFAIESITENCIAVPFKVSNNIINAKKWLILQSKHFWYQSFLEHLGENLE